MAIEAAAASVKDDEYFKETLLKVIKTRQHTANEFEKMGFNVFPSHANFLLVSHDDFSAKEIFEACKKENIFIRYFNLPRIDNHLRITIGTDEQMKILIDFVKNYVK